MKPVDLPPDARPVEAKPLGHWSRPIALIWLAAAALLLAIAAWSGATTAEIWPTLEIAQDLPIVVAAAALFFLFSECRRRDLWRWRTPVLRPVPVVATLALTVVAIAWLGHRYAFAGISLSRDEDLALFQGALIAKGHLLGKIPEPWRDFGAALQPSFMILVPGGGYWLSSYLPGNSALQALGVALGLDGAVSPVLAAVAIVATYGVGRQMWPDDRRPAFLAAALVATSAQPLVTAMTPFAMSAHLALNMVWLWLFLRGGRLGHAGAILTGALATGLHQLVFHPLFAAPFILDLWLRRRWRLAALYTAAYAAIGLFWLSYWHLVLGTLGGAQPAAASAVETPRALGSAIALLGAFGPEAFGVMTRNLIRFMAWQNPLTAPLTLIGAVAAWRCGGVLRSLLLGMLLTTLALLLLMPDHGLGWGYRYLHGCIGAAALLAAWTWIRLTARLGETGKREAATLLGCVLVLSAPLTAFRIWQAHELIAPFARADRYLKTLDVDVVLVGKSGIFMPRALTRHVTPEVDNRPLPIALDTLTPAQLRKLCAGRTVALFQASDAARFGILTSFEAPESRRRQEEAERDRLRGLECRV